MFCSWRTSSSKLSRYDIQKELETAQKDYWEQMLLPKVLEAEDPEIFSDNSTQTFTENIKQVLKESEKMQINFEAGIKRQLKKFGDEKRFLVNAPAEEVLKGFPDVELKWMFGQKEVAVPKAASLHLFHGWKKWREEAKANLKRDLLENKDYGREYMTRRQVAF